MARCEAVLLGEQCILPADHVDEHESESMYWATGPVLVLKHAIGDNPFARRTVRRAVP